MALSDLVVFNEYAYGTFIQLLRHNISLFNEATGGGILLRSSKLQGSYVDSTFWLPATVVERRNANAETAISSQAIQMDDETKVRIDSRTKELRFQEAHMRRILQDPKGQGVVFGKMVAQQRFNDMLTTGLGSYCAAMAAIAGVYQDFSGETPGSISYSRLADLKQKRGDKSSEIGCWVMHSLLATDLLKSNISNAQTLFNFGTVNVKVDAEGRRIVVTDIPALVVSGAPTDYLVPGLAPGAIVIEDQGDWNANEVRINGFEQIVTSYQAEWSYFLQILGFSWDKTSGGSSPNNAALFTAGNWDRVYTNDVKDLGGVLGRFTAAA